MQTVIDPRTRRKVIVAPLAQGQQQLPPSVTTGPGKYTVGTPIPSRTATRAPNPVTRVDLPALQQLLQPAPPSTGRYTQSRAANRNTQGLAPLAQAQASIPSLIPAAEARPLTAPQPLAQAQTVAAGGAEPARVAPVATGRQVASSDPVELLLQGRQLLSDWTGGAEPPGAAPITAADAQQDLAAPGTLPLASGQGYFRNNQTGALDVINSQPRAQAVPALAQPAQPAPVAGSPAPPQDQPVDIPTLNPNLSIGGALAEFMGRLGQGYRTHARNVAAGTNFKRGLAQSKEAREVEEVGRKALPTLDQVKAQRVQELRQNPEKTSPLDQLLFNKHQPLAQKVYNKKEYDDVGFQTGDLPYTLDAEGNAVPVQFPGAPQGGPPPGQPEAPPGAIAKLKANPALAAAFQQKYGYLPQGI